MSCSKATILIAFVFLVFDAGTVSTQDSARPFFSIQFLGRDIQFNLDPQFSAHHVAEEFCIFHGLEPHVRAVRELIENTLADAFKDRIEDALAGNDIQARWFVDAVCRDFPPLHGSPIPEICLLCRPLSLMLAVTDRLPMPTFTVRSSPRFIIDAFPFFNELDVLEVRLKELGPVVDKFILVESAMTHSGHPKNLTFDDNRERFEPFLEKIVHVVLDTLPDSPDHWVRERSQRDAIHEGLAQSGAEGDDLLLVSDTDEIPRRSTIRALSWCEGYSPPLQLRSTFFYYSLRHRWTEIQNGEMVPFQWAQPRAALVSQMQFPARTVNHLRYDPGEYNFQVIYHASWHLSFFGGEERIRTKILSYAHQENNVPENIAASHIQSAIKEGKDLFGRGNPHGELLPTTEPYDIPFPVLADIAQSGTESMYAEWLAEEFLVSEFVEGWGPAAGEPQDSHERVEL